MELTHFRLNQFALQFPAVTKMTKQEQWVLWVFLVLVAGGLAGKIWLRSRPSAALPPLPGTPATESAR